MAAPRRASPAVAQYSARTTAAVLVVAGIAAWARSWPFMPLWYLAACMLKSAFFPLPAYLDQEGQPKHPAWDIAKFGRPFGDTCRHPLSLLPPNAGSSEPVEGRLGRFVPATANAWVALGVAGLVALLPQGYWPVSFFFTYLLVQAASKTQRKLVIEGAEAPPCPLQPPAFKERMVAIGQRARQALGSWRSRIGAKEAPDGKEADDDWEDDDWEDDDSVMSPRVAALLADMARPGAREGLPGSAGDALEKDDSPVEGEDGMPEHIFRWGGGLVAGAGLGWVVWRWGEPAMRVHLPRATFQIVPVIQRVWWTTAPLPAWLLVGLGTAAFFLVLPGWRRRVAEHQAAWAAQMQERQAWMQRWMACRVSPAVFVRTSSAAVNTPFSAAVFQCAPGTPVSAYQQVQARLASVMGTASLMVAPIALGGGGAHPSAFEVVWLSSGQYRLDKLMTDPQNRLAALYAARMVISNLFADLRMEPPMVQQAPAHLGGGLFRTVWQLGPGCTPSQVIQHISNIRARLPFDWAGVNVQVDSQRLVLLYGVRPNPALLAAIPDKDARLQVQAVVWEQWLRDAGVVSRNGAMPELRAIKTGLPGQLEAACFLPASGLPLEQIENCTGALVSAIQRAYVHVEPMIPDAEWPAGSFQVVYGDADPLDKAYMFEDFAPLLLTPTKLGQPDITFVVGIGADGCTIRFDHDTELAHVIIGGGSGAGKSTLLHSIIVQLSYKNSPADLAFYIADPKNELSRYGSLPHLQHMVTMNSIAKDGSNSPYACFADMVEMLDEEMERRYRVFQTLPGRPQKLSQARMIDPQACQDMPYIEVVVDECSDYFIKPTGRDQVAHWDRLIRHSETLARKARGAGIYMILATQRPTKQSLPMVIKGMASRIGLMTSDKVSSMVVIDQPGLETIKTRGRGLVSAGKGYKGFRALLLRKPDESHPDWPDDLELLLEKMGAVADQEPAAAMVAKGAPLPSPDLVWGSDASLTAAPE